MANANTATSDQAKFTTIRRKAATDWGSLISDAESSHWRTLKVTIALREKLHAGKPKQLDAAAAMIAARGLSDVLEAVEITDPIERASLAEKAKDDCICEFYRRDGKSGIWMPSNQVKAMLKENWSVLGYNKDARPRNKRKDAGDDGKEQKALRGSRGALAEGVFVFGVDKADREWIYLGEQPDGMDTNPSHTIGPSGPQSSIKRNEFIFQRKIAFIVQMARAVVDRLPDESFADALLHAGKHGLGANRSQGQGTFDIVSVEDLESW